MNCSGDNKREKQQKKKDFKELKTQNGGVRHNIKEHYMYNKDWMDQLRCKKMKLEKMIERGNGMKDNANFEKDKKGFFKTLQEEIVFEGEPPPMEQFVDFWAGIWEKDKEHQKCHGCRK